MELKQGSLSSEYDGQHAGEEEPLEFEELISGVENEVDLLNVCIQIANANGYKYFSIVMLPRDDGSKLSEISLLGNFPSNFVSQYDQLNLLGKSPLMSHLSTTTEPLIFDIESMNRDRGDGKGNEVVKLFHEYGFFVGLCFSAHLPDGTVGAVIFAGESHDPTKKKIMELHLLATLLFEKAAKYCESNAHLHYAITKLEMECLRWTAQGKSTHEVSELLGMSKYTVSLIMKSVVKKLSAANNAHAVIIAKRKSLIE